MACFVCAVWLLSTLISHNGHHGHKGETKGFTLVSFVPFVAIQRRD